MNPSTPIKITINGLERQPISINQWSIYSENAEDDKCRVSVEFNGLSYSVVLDDKNPRIETWCLNPAGEIDKMISFSTLPTNGNTVLNRKN